MSYKPRTIMFFLLLLFISVGPSVVATAHHGISVGMYTPTQADYEELVVNIEGAEVKITKTPDAFDGYNLFVLLQVYPMTQERQFFMLIVDMNGDVVLEKYLDGNYYIADCPAEFIDPSTILVRASDTAALYDLNDGSMTLLPFDGHHEFEYNPLDDTFFTLHYNNVEIGGEDYGYDTLLEFNRQGDIVWSFDVSSLIGVNQSCPYQDFLMSYPDISHSNSVYYDVEDDSIYLNLRNANTFWKIDHSTSDVVWGLGEYGNFSLYNEWGQPTDNLFFHGHAVERVDDDTFILFDNDYHNQTDEWNQVSRIIEITINEDTMAASTSWVWASEKEYSSYLWGDADRLPNGNRIGVFGVPYRYNTSFGGRLVEVNEDQEIVWEMSFISNESIRYGLYRNERFQFQPILQVLDARNTYTLGDITIDWQTWFNYRPKMDVHGTFDLYLDDVLIQNGEVIFDRYWRPTHLSYTFQNLLPGTHNATLVVWDGYGHSANVMTVVNVTSIVVPILLFGVTIIGVVALIVVWKLKFRN